MIPDDPASDDRVDSYASAKAANSAARAGLKAVLDAKVAAGATSETMDKFADAPRKLGSGDNAANAFDRAGGPRTV